MNFLKPLTYIPVRYFLPAIWIVAITIASLYAYNSVKDKYTTTLLQDKELEEINFFTHSKENAAHALHNIEDSTHLKKMFTLFSNNKERILGLYSFAKKEDISSSNLELLLQDDGFNSQEKFEDIQSTLCAESGINTLHVKQGVFYLFGAVGKNCNDLLYFERVDFEYKILQQNHAFFELVMRLLAILLIAMIIIRIVIYFIFHKRLETLFTIMKKRSGSFIQSSDTIEGKDEIAQLAQVFNEVSHQLSGILDDMYTFVALIDTKGKILFVNNTPLAISNLSFKDVYQQHFADALWWSYDATVKKKIIMLQQKAMAGEKVQHDIQIQIADNKRIWITFSMHPVYNSDGHLLHLVAEGVDITRQREAYDKLLKQNPKAQMGEMMDAVAHQWKQPLNALSMYSDILKSDFSDNLVDDVYIEDMTEGINTQIEHMTKTLTEFRNFLRPSSEIVHVKLRHILDAVELLVKDEFLKNGITIHINIDEDIELFVNENEFKHIILNLINNAKDAFNERDINERIINILASTDKGKIIIRIEDNAGGIPPEVINHIFEENFTTKAKGEGTGIGLYFSSQILHKMGAQMSVNNTLLGACFTIKIKT